MHSDERSLLSASVSLPSRIPVLFYFVLRPKSQSALWSRVRAACSDIKLQRDAKELFSETVWFKGT